VLGFIFTWIVTYNIGCDKNCLMYSNCKRLILETPKGKLKSVSDNRVSWTRTHLGLYGKTWIVTQGRLISKDFDIEIVI